MTEIRYEDWENYINKAAWHQVKAYGGDFDEWKSEANMGFVYARGTFNPEKATFKTYLYISMNGFFRNVIIQRKNKAVYTVGDVDEIPKSDFDIVSFLSDLGEEAREIVGMVLNTPGELIEMLKNTSRGLTLTLLRTYMNKATGMDHKTISEAIKEIKENLQEV